MPAGVLRKLKSALPLVLALVLFVLGVLALMHLLHKAGPHEIAAGIHQTSWTQLGLALAGTVVGYAALVSYDFFGLRFIGRHLPAPTVMLAGFLGVAFGSNLGVSAVSGGAVRYRIYAPKGLGALDVAMVSGYVAMAMGLGLTVVGLVALIFHPGAAVALLPYRGWMIQSGATAALVLTLVVMLYLSVSGRQLTLWHLNLRMPPPRDLGAQALAAVIDVAAASFTLWVLLPADRPDLVSLVPVYAAAIMIGVLSHVPGGVGVFEAVVLGTLPHGVPPGPALAALLVFRCIYYLLPLASAVLLMVLHAAGGGVSRLRRPPPGKPLQGRPGAGPKGTLRVQSR